MSPSLDEFRPKIEIVLVSDELELAFIAKRNRWFVGRPRQLPLSGLGPASIFRHSSQNLMTPERSAATGFVS